MIRIEGAEARLGGATVVHDLTLDVPKGAFFALIGPSGSGKSTTLRLINRLIEPSAGRIAVDGQDIMSVPPEQLRRRIGYAIQSVGLFPHWTVARNMAAVPALLDWPRARIAKRVEELLDLLRLEPGLARKYPHELSGGQQQRVGVARALAADPPVLLMDEPFGALDPLTRDDLQGAIADIHRRTGKTIVMVTHDMREAFRLADQVAVLEDGRLSQTGTPDQLRAGPSSGFVRGFIERGIA